MEKTPEWIRIPEELADSRVTVTFRGARLALKPSAYDVPEAICGYWDESNRRFTARFRYIGGDEGETEQPQEVELPAVRVWVGKRSRRIFRIEVDAPRPSTADHLAVDCDEIRGLADEAITRLEQSTPNPRVGNYEVARRAIRELDPA